MNNKEDHLGHPN